MSTPFWVKTLYPYEAESENELSFEEGVHVQVLDNSSDWWLGSINGEQGYFPKNFVEIDPEGPPNNENTNENSQQQEQNGENQEQQEEQEEEQDEQEGGEEEETEEQKGQNMGGVSIGLNMGDILSARKNLGGSSTPKKTFVRPEKKEEPKVTNELFAMLNRRKQINKEKKLGQGQGEKPNEPPRIRRSTIAVTGGGMRTGSGTGMGRGRGRPLRGRGRPMRRRGRGRGRGMQSNGTGRGGPPDIERGRGGIRKAKTVGSNVSDMNKTNNTVDNELSNLKRNNSVKDKFAMFNNPNKTSVRQTIALTGNNTNNEHSKGRGIPPRRGRGRGMGRPQRGGLMGRGGTSKPRPLTSAFSTNKNLIAGLFQGPMNPLMKGAKPKPKKDPDIVEVKTETKSIQSENIKQENQERESSVEKILENKIVENEITLVCIYDFEPQGEGEIKLMVGDKIKFSHFEGEGWSFGTIIGTDVSGYFPNEFVEEAPKETVIVQQKIEEKTQRTSRLKTVRRARPGRKKRRPTSRRSRPTTTQLKKTENSETEPPKIPQLPNRSRRPSPLPNSTDKVEETTDNKKTEEDTTKENQEIKKASTPKRKIETPKKTEIKQSPNISNEIKKTKETKQAITTPKTTEIKETKTKMEHKEPKEHKQPKQPKESLNNIPPRKTKTDTKKETLPKNQTLPKKEEKTIGKLRPITGNSDSVMVFIINGFISEIKNLPMGTSGIVFAPSEDIAKKMSQTNKKSLVLVINFQNGILGTLWHGAKQVPFQSKFN
ncbi:endophilin-a [Anaeramoeba flamelloides]|uniref:Endophilin-a n=1 Tax=Anaeramoeba flamelloides TaxID=1746091 RepID=A0AAV8A8I4_9EUKA|nr:endophilin-a [Anaeramoeba flamelloides]